MILCDLIFCLLDFTVPKTPQRKTRGLKVKTPVVTVTPPSRKTKKHVTESEEGTDEKGMFNCHFIKSLYMDKKVSGY